MNRIIRVTALAVICLSVPVMGQAADDEKLSITASATMKEVLSGLTGKRVAVKFSSGEEVEGTVVIVGNSLVHLSRLSGKEFYDSVISLQDISAVRVRAREPN